MSDRSHHPRAPHPMLAMALTVELGLVALAVVLGWLTGRPPWRAIQINGAGFAAGVLATLPLLLMLWAVLSARWQPLRRLRRKSIRLIGPLFADCGVGALASIALSAGLGEELLFRGVLQPLLSRWLSTGSRVAVAAPWLVAITANVLVSLIFASLHALSRSYFVLAFLVSLYLGFLYLLGSNLLAPIVTHALYDFVALLIIKHIWQRRHRAQPSP